MLPKKCPKCGTAVADDLPGGLCPACLMDVARKSQPGSARSYSGAMETPSISEMTEMFPQFEILGIIGRGGMGAVYKARQKSLDRIVALKIFLYRPDDPEFAARFGREARALAKLNHPNIVTVHEIGKENGLNFLVMEHIDGLNLRQLCQEKLLAPSEAMQLVPQLCQALQYAHDNGVIHRDIKPENILVDQTGQIKIADFGLAKMTGATINDPTLTRTQQVMGTLNYMAPEQRERPTEVDHRADIYSLGVVIYEMLTGELPLGRFQPPSKKVEVDIRIDEIVMRALEKEPELRYQQISEFQTGLESVGDLAEFNVRQPVARAPSPTRGAQTAFTGQQIPLNQPQSPDPAYKNIDSDRPEVTVAKVLEFMYNGAAMFLIVVAAPLIIIMGSEQFDILDRRESTPIGIVVALLGAYLFCARGWVRRILGWGPADSKPKTVKQYNEMTWIGSLLRMVGIFMFFACAMLLVLGREMLDDEEVTFAGVAAAVVGGAIMMFTGSLEATFFKRKKKR